MVVLMLQWLWFVLCKVREVVGICHFGEAFLAAVLPG